MKQCFVSSLKGILLQIAMNTRALWLVAKSCIGKLRPGGQKRPVWLLNPARQTCPDYVDYYIFKSMWEMIHRCGGHCRYVRPKEFSLSEFLK